MNYEEKTVSKEHIYDGSIIKVDSLTVMLPNGKEAKRDIISHPGGAVVIPISSDGCLYMVRQYRKAVDMELLELPAGKLDYGEDPKVCAIRELKEETGLEAGSIRYMAGIYSTPGFCNELLHMYAATQLTEGEACTDEDEFLSCEKIPVKKLVEMVLAGEITDSKTIIGILMADKILKGEM
ncbi:ADP-ribose pyrophosphatase [Anaerobacterium chartisolvens]|uniref:ADP-ribose pyrophosphatase n=1 Tax=Anaerobacterium chartisolvens TaxID=1297424 RepID=A0A369BDK3_9FIRM|nr:NUDIX hydrolase [Anaerobacterium chartisolvens]RCX19305.1 ADP-ribose pyrophosphatase [Anaerobacterium chartisolvens]